MNSTSILDTPNAHEAMLKGLDDLIRSKLRTRILEKIEPDIQAAVDDAMAAFKIGIETWREPMSLRDTIKVLIEDRRKP